MSVGIRGWFKSHCRAYVLIPFCFIDKEIAVTVLLLGGDSHQIELPQRGMS